MRRQGSIGEYLAPDAVFAMKASPAIPADPEWRRPFLWVAGVALAVWWACFQFPAVWTATGIGEANRPFMDLYGILAACDAARAGVDPFLPNNFDPYHRPHVYSAWWLELRRLGLTRADTLWLGAVLVGMMLLAAVVLTRPCTRREGIGLLLLLISPAFLMAVNRANSDLVVFLLISGGLLCFRSGSGPARAAGVLLFAVASVLKYYPLVTLVTLLGIRSRRGLAASLGLYALVLVLAWPGLEPGLKSAAKFMPQPNWLYAYGAPVLLRNLGLATTWGWLLPAGLMTLWAGSAAWRKFPDATAEASGAERDAEREFIVGAVMLVGLFFLGSSYVYKLVFAVWLLPWLWLNHQNPTEGRWARATLGQLLVVVWFEGAMALGLNLGFGSRGEAAAFMLLKGTLVASQLLTWVWVACLLRLLLPMLGRQIRAWGRNNQPAVA